MFSSSMLYTFSLIVCILMILLSFYALAMALIRFRKQNGSSDPQVQKTATKQLVAGIIASIFLCVTGTGMLLVVLYFIFR